jgi:hypothetical protein
MNFRAWPKLKSSRCCLLEPISRMRRFLLNLVLETVRSGMSTTGSLRAKLVLTTFWPIAVILAMVSLSRFLLTARPEGVTFLRVVVVFFVVVFFFAM